MSWKRSILHTLCLTAAIITSCHQKTITTEKQTHEATKYKTEINWVGHWQREGKRQQLVEEVGTEYEFLNQDTKVNLVYIDSILPESNDATEIAFIINEVTAEHPRFDIIRLKDYYLKVAEKLNDLDWAKKSLVDFSEFQDFKENHQPFIFDESHKADNGGITVGPYNEGFYWAIWYNKVVADKMGITVKSQGMTADDFLGYVKAAHEYNVKNNTDITPIFEEANWITLENVMLQLFVSEFGDIKELQKKEYNPQNLKKLESVLKVFEELSKYEPTFKDRSKVSWWGSLRYPLDEKCLFYIQGSWMYNIWENIDKTLVRNMYPVEMPTMKGQSPCYFGGYKACWAVPKNAPHKAEAIKFLKYWSSSQVAETWVRYTKCPTGLRGNVTDVTLGLDQFEDFQYKLNQRFPNRMIPLDGTYIFGMKNRKVSIPLMDIVEKRKSVAQVMAIIRNQIKN